MFTGLLIDPKNANNHPCADHSPQFSSLQGGGKTVNRVHACMRDRGGR